MSIGGVILSVAKNPCYRLVRVLLVTSLFFPACRPSASPPTTGSASQPDPFRVLCSFTPAYIFTLNIVGGTPGVSVALLQPPNMGCPHGHEISTGDTERMADADVLIFLGGVDDRARRTAQATSKHARIVVAAPENAAGDTGHAGHSHGDAGEHHHDHTHGAEHQWLSPTQAVKMVQAIADGLASEDPAHEANYRRNAAAYVIRLNNLAEESRTLKVRLRGRAVALVSDMYPVVLSDLELKTVGPVLSPNETDTSPQRLGELIEAVRANRPAAVLAEPGRSEQFGRTVEKESGVKLIVLDPIVGSEGPIRASDYEDRMRANYKKLEKGLHDAAE